MICVKKRCHCTHLVLTYPVSHKRIQISVIGCRENVAHDGPLKTTGVARDQAHDKDSIVEFGEEISHCITDALYVP